MERKTFPKDTDMESAKQHNDEKDMLVSDPSPPPPPPPSEHQNRDLLTKEDTTTHLQDSNAQTVQDDAKDIPDIKYLDKDDDKDDDDDDPNDDYLVLLHSRSKAKNNMEQVDKQDFLNEFRKDESPKHNNIGSPTTTGHLLTPLNNAHSKQLFASSTSTTATATAIAIDASPRFSHPPAPYPFTYSTTLCLIFALHWIFYVQWKKRTVRHQIQVSYYGVTIQRKYHLAFWSYLSHVPIHARAYRSNSAVHGHGHGHGHVGGNEGSLPFTTPSSSSSPNRLFSRMCARITTPIQRRLRRFTILSTLSSLPLLTYISHLLWEIRSLEEYMYRSNISYMKLIGIAMLSCSCLKLLYSWTLERFIESIHLRGRERRGLSFLGRHYDPQLRRRAANVDATMTNTTTTNSSTVTNRRNYTTLRDFYYHYASSTFTPIITSLLVIYANLLPHVPLQILPFVPILQFSASEVGFFLCTLILASGCAWDRNVLLAMTSTRSVGREHLQIWNVWIGLVNGLFLSWNLDLLLIHASYWINGIFGFYFIMCLLSLWMDLKGSQAHQSQSQSNTNGGSRTRWSIPCVDHVGWNKDGILDEANECERVFRDGLSTVNQEEEEQENGEEFNQHIPMSSPNIFAPNETTTTTTTRITQNEEEDDPNFNAFARSDENSILDESEDLEMGEEDTFVSWNSNNAVVTPRVSNNSSSGSNSHFPMRNRGGNNLQHSQSSELTRPFLNEEENPRDL